MASLGTDILADLIRAKRACLAQLRDMGRQQLEWIEAGEMTRLLDVLSARQRTIGQLQRIERALDPFRADDPQQRRWRSPQDRAACAEQLQQCETLLGEIVSQEKCSEAALIRRRDQSAARLQEIHLAAHARGAYAASPSPINQVDLCSEG
jgi:hypothetical protein